MAREPHPPRRTDVNPTPRCYCPTEGAHASGPFPASFSVGCLGEWPGLQRGEQSPSLGKLEVEVWS